MDVFETAQNVDFRIGKDYASAGCVFYSKLCLRKRVRIEIFRESERKSLLGRFCREVAIIY